VPAGGMVDAELPAPSARGLDLLQPDSSAAGITGSTPTPKPRPATLPQAPAAVAPHAAGPAASAPLNLLRP
jgi:hypothetical protein